MPKAKRTAAIPKRTAATPKRTAATPKAPASTTTAHTGGVTQPGPTSGTQQPAGGSVQASTTGDSGFGYLGWFTVDDEGCIVQFGIDQQQYRLDADTPNYNALYSMLLACWLDRRKVNLTYSNSLLVATQDAPLRIVSLVTI
jgi:hypothetical protein